MNINLCIGLFVLGAIFGSVFTFYISVTDFKVVDKDAKCVFVSK